MPLVSPVEDVGHVGVARKRAGDSLHRGIADPERVVDRGAGVDRAAVGEDEEVGTAEPVEVEEVADRRRQAGLFKTGFLGFTDEPVDGRRMRLPVRRGGP
jgi:hypothetical protein